MIQHVTDLGKDMMAEFLQGEAALEFTRFAVGSGSFDPDGQDPRTMTGLIKETASVDVTKVLKEDAGVAVYADLGSKDIPGGTKLAETGLYARIGSGEERLFCYAYSTTPDTLPPASETYYTRRFVSHIKMTDDEGKFVFTPDSYKESIRETLGLYRDGEGYLCQN